MEYIDSIIPFIQKYNINIKGILHIGANDCIEYDEYSKFTNNIIYVEANPEIVDNIHLTKKYINIYQALITDRDNEEYEFKISNNNSQSSSILDFNLHKNNHPNVNFINKIKLKSITIDTFLEKKLIPYNNINVLVLDIQGVELKALKGASQLLNNIDIIYTEVNIDDTYKDCDKLDSMDIYLKQYNFKRIYTYIFYNHTYGDAVYIKTT